MKTLVSQKIGAKTIVVVVVVAILIGVSLIISNLLPELPATSTSTDCSAYYTTQTRTSRSGRTSTVQVPINGTCIYQGLLLSVDADVTTCNACLNKAALGNYIAWCANKVPPELCQAPELTKVDAAVNSAASARDSIIRELNDGARTDYDLKNLWLLDKASSVNLACGGSAMSDYTATAETVTLKNDKNLAATTQVPFLSMVIGNVTVRGTVPLVQKFAIMWSRMYDRPSGTYGLCSGLPASCTISSSYRANEYHNYNGQWLLGPHGKGEGVDIKCIVPASSSGCTGDAATALAKIKKYNEGFNIVQECSTTERKACGDGVTSVQVIHVDLGGVNRNTGNGGACLYTGCDFTNCLPL